MPIFVAMTEGRGWFIGSGQWFDKLTMSGCGRRLVGVGSHVVSNYN